jgi:hypothetical protein
MMTQNMWSCKQFTKKNKNVKAFEHIFIHFYMDLGPRIHILTYVIVTRLRL